MDVNDLYTAPCRTRHEALAIFQSTTSAERVALERAIATRHKRDSRFTLQGICRVDHAVVDFLVDRQWGARQLEDGVWLPNWRERLDCPICGLNNRQRAIAAAVLDELGRRPASGVVLYMMEQVTPMFGVVSERARGVTVHGSEYVGPGHSSGEVVRGVRHEDAEALSFASGSIDVLVSNEVFEHVPHPSRALTEAARVLRPGGVMLFTVPFYTDRLQSTARAELVNGTVRHLAEPEYHGNPFASGGSLVFTDFGWELLDVARASGFRDCVALAYWSLEYGHLGSNNLYFVASR